MERESKEAWNEIRKGRKLKKKSIWQDIASLRRKQKVLVLDRTNQIEERDYWSASGHIRRPSTDPRGVG